MHYLIVPGLNNSGPDHWQSFWTNSLIHASRVYQHCWDKPQKEEWIEILDKTIISLKSDTILVAHSLGVVTVAHWLLRKAKKGFLPGYIKGAFLVAPADADQIEIIKNFAPMPTEKLPIPSCIVGSENDPYMTWDRTKLFAEHWGATLFNAGKLGHINSDSKLGEWEQGQKFLQTFEKQVIEQKR